MKLELTEAVRKTMATAAALSPAQGWSSRVDDWLPVVDEMFAAANSIPEGAPVGTIARRPDGAWIAERDDTYGDTGYWNYRSGALWHKSLPVLEYDADSWPVIYDPTSTEPAGVRERIADAVTGEIDQCSYDSQHHVSRAFAETMADKIADLLWPDPTAQQEPEDPEWFEHAARENAEQLVKVVAKTPRTPRVVDRLGVDEQGSRWRGRILSLEYRHDGTTWWGGAFMYPDWVHPTLGAPFTEILEPRVLPSLDCEEARDGTVWVDGDDHNPWQFRYSDRWECTRPGGSWRTVQVEELLTVAGPYKEVLGDPT